MADMIPNPVGLHLTPTLTPNEHINAVGSTFNIIGRDQYNFHVSNVSLSTLPYAEGASWNPSLMCLSGTRTTLLSDIWKWINEADSTKAAEIFFLSDVAGTGKSAIAHTVAHNCHKSGFLASSFFFDRDIPDRNHPQKFFSTIVRDIAVLSKDLAEHINIILENDRSLASAPQFRQFDELILKPFQVHRHHILRPIVLVIDALDEGCDLDTLKILCDKVPDLPGTFRIFVTSRPKDDIFTKLSLSKHVKCRSINIHGDSNKKDIALYIQERMRYIASQKRLGADWPGLQVAADFMAKAEGLFIWASTVSNYLSTTIYPEKKLRKLLYEYDPSGLHAEAKMDKLYAEILNTCDWNDEDFVDGYKLLIGAIVAVKTPLSMSALQCLHLANPTLLKVDEVLRPLSSVLTGLDDESRPIQFLHISFRDFLTCRAQASPAHERFYVSDKEHSRRLAILCIHIMNEQLKPEIPGTGYLTRQRLGIEGIPEIDESSVSEALWYACRFWAEHIIEVEGPLSEEVLDAVGRFLSGQLLIWMEVLHSKFEFQSLAEVRAWVQRTCPMLVTSAYEDKQAASLVELSRRFRYMGRREDAMKAIEEAVKLYRELDADRSATFIPDLAMSLHNLSRCLSDLGRREEAMKAIEESVELRRQLAADDPATFIPDLAISLNNLSNRLSNLGRLEEAMIAIEEAVELLRQLTADDPATFTPNLARSLIILSHCSFNLGRREEAMKAIEEAVELLRQLAADHPATFIPDLAGSLSNFSICLSNLGRLEEAMKVIEEAVELQRQLAADHPATFITDLARSLDDFSNCLSNLGRREEAMKAIEEAVELRRQLAADRPATFIPDLAGSLNNLSHRLSNLGRREEAMKAIEESVELQRQLAADHPAAFTPNFATSLNNLSVRLSDLGRLEEAMKAIEEAVELRRQLAADHPATFIPDFATSLNNLSNRLSGLGRREEAMKAIEEAVQLRRRLAADGPATFIPDLATSLNNLSLRLSDLGRLEEAMKAIEESIELWRQLTADHPATFIPDLARFLNNLCSCLSNLGRLEEAMKAIEESVELLRQLAADYPATFTPDLATSLNNLSVCLSKLGRREEAMKAIEEAVELQRQLAADCPAAFIPHLAGYLMNLSFCLSNLGCREDAQTATKEALKLLQQT